MNRPLRLLSVGAVRRHRLLLLGVCLLVLLTTVAFQFGLIVRPRSHLEIVNQARREIRKEYFDPQIAQEMDRAMEQRIQNGEHRGFGNALSLMIGLTATMRGISQDRHIFVGYSFIPHSSNTERATSKDELAEEARRESEDNFGLRRVEELADNVRYIELARFADPGWAEQALYWDLAPEVVWPFISFSAFIQLVLDSALARISLF